MKTPTSPIIPSAAQASFPLWEMDETDWAKRGEFWQEQKAPRSRGRPSLKIKQPLVLTGHGVRLSVDHGALLVQNGFTHYPQKREEWRLFPSDHRLPSRIVILDGSGSISFEVMNWLSVQNVPLVQINWQGEVITLLGGMGHSADSNLVAAQRAALKNGNGLQIATGIIYRKIQGCLQTLKEVLPPSLQLERAISKQEKALLELTQNPPATMEDLRLIEGRAALGYFKAWQSQPMQWKGTARKPIAESWKTVGLRQSSLSGTNRHANHPVNAMLNYAYGVLESEMRIATVSAGLDPTIGYLHANRPGRLALVYDLMEPVRPIVDRAILKFIQKRIFSPADFISSKNGLCRVHAQLAKAIVQLGIKNEDLNPTVMGFVREIKILFS
jgi:CRISPR-associated endonuclease Cas1